MRAFLQDLALGIARLQSTRLMLLEDGGAGKTTLSAAMRVCDEPTLQLTLGWSRISGKSSKSGWSLVG